MSFTFKWPRFSDSFHEDAIQMLNSALNKGAKPPVIADRIEVVELEMGTQPPELEIRDIGDLTMDQFRGIFRLTYSGNAYIVLKTMVQANSLYHKKPDLHLMGGSKGILAANQPLVVPMHLRLSDFKLNSYVVLVVSKRKGITLVFKTDPLQSVDISSTFDSIGVIQDFIRREIEGQLKRMFREDLPGIIHRLSQQWVKTATAETLHQVKKPPPLSRHSSAGHPHPESGRLNAPFPGPPSILGPLPHYHQSRHGFSSFSDTLLLSQRLISDRPSARAPFLYRRRPARPRGTYSENEPDDSVLSSTSTSYQTTKDISTLFEEGSALGMDWEINEPLSPPSRSWDELPVVETKSANSKRPLAQSRGPHSPLQSYPEYATPWFNGLDVDPSPYPRIPSGYIPLRYHNGEDRNDNDSNTIHHHNPYFHTTEIRRLPLVSSSSYGFEGTKIESATSYLAGNDVNEPRQGGSDISVTSSPPEYLDTDEDDRVVLRPGKNNVISQLSFLNHSNQTLSPFTRSLEHFTVRSVPPKSISPFGASSAPERLPVKAKRKRLYRLGGSNDKSTKDADYQQSSALYSKPPSEFDASDIDRYFCEDDTDHAS